ncbi:MAG TPA: hypothetical protein VMH91_03185 [Candidatus Paceibacterota bacterium]|nr:hypothetical protein [Candidatus Paceibacterota bacterium]
MTHYAPDPHHSSATAREVVRVVLIAFAVLYIYMAFKGLPHWPVLEENALTPREQYILGGLGVVCAALAATWSWIWPTGDE